MVSYPQDHNMALCVAWKLKCSLAESQKPMDYPEPVTGPDLYFITISMFIK
jgi:hypothetical protein